ncbi:MAG TPA: peptidoglycan DD-metalloendopeptidase family protein [Firmicutes bacterium]|jgi:murein DD-endopeptidase MepM/ murein hydrolase activator NlpD|nr:peptidoglycan DD-metalloendopeptidase family protein [Bacillota bacterium]HOQ23443.1 peptidoglycan DD-metalloendopeptidase family protein [Bacillota bacterium]
MPRRHRWLLLGFVFMSVILLTEPCPPSVYGVTNVDKLIHQKEKQLKAKKDQERRTKSALTKVEKDLARVEVNLERIEKDLGVATNKLAEIQRQITLTKARLSELEQERNTYRRKLDERLTALYKYGMSSYLEVLVSAQNFSEIINRFEIVGFYLRHDLALLDKVEKQCQEIDEQRQMLTGHYEDLQREKNRIGALKKQHIKAKDRLAIAVTRRERELARIQKDRERLERELDELEKTSRELEETIRKKQGSGPALGTGKIQWPLRGRISSPFGWRRHPVLKKRKYHTGIDIAAPHGLAIRASDHGIVIYSGWNGGYGKMISIDHGNKISTLYAHCSRLFVEKGDRVTQGQHIANVGSTGLSTGPHLHFEVRVNGTPDNPMNYLP